MTPRERVLTSLNHREPDRVPLDFSGHRSSGIAAIAYAKLRKYLGLKERPIRVYDPIQQLAIVDDDVLDLFGVDTIELGRGFAQEDSAWADWVLPDGTPCQMPAWALPERAPGEWVYRSKSGRVIARMPDGALYFEQAYFPFMDEAGPKTIADAFPESMWTAIASPPGPLVEGPGGLERLAEGARKLREKTDRAIIGLFGGNLLEIGQFLYRNDNFFMLLAGEPKKAHEFLDQLVAIHLESLERYLGAVGKYIDVINFGDDLGMQTGPQMSPAMYREFFKPRHKLMWTRAKQLANVKVMLHSCGGVRELMPDLIEANLDAINPVQISCKGMDAAELKKEFGREMVFWGGGCDTQNVLSRGTPESVRANVRKQIEILSPGGGFVFQQVHNVLANVPPENVVAMMEAVNGQTAATLLQHQ
ncbi:MAG TPA: uroporphyrinogen decarboxylase family protein [Terriglobia bacterium]|nr:uroporphyrinogen decarboxylase family protein [Terriglobia bacterium]